MTTSNFKVNIKATTGICDTELFRKVCEHGDLNALRVKEHIGDIIHINGTCDVTIQNNDEVFDITYYACDEGVYSTGSKIFKDSVTDYLGDINVFRITSIYTRKGTSFKASPVFYGSLESFNV
jgi:hypothetical protein